jgi:hypothetical protein
MISRDYTTKVNDLDASETYATLTRGSVYIEVPKGALSEDEIQLSLDDALLSACLANFFKGQCRDDVYCDKQIVRQDYSTGISEAVALVEQLQETFPDYDNWLRWEYNILGRYTAYREPYTNTGISFYNFGVKPSEELLLRFGTSYLMDNLYEWYGLKFDLETEEVMLKVVFKNYDGDTPELPQNARNFYAQTHHQDGTLNDLVDYYAYGTPKLIRQFCEDKGLAYPLPTTTHTDCDVVWCWGFVFNRQTLEYGPVKAYARYNLPNEV